MSTNKIYATKGDVVTFSGSGGTILWTPQAIAGGNGRISSVWDRGAGSLPTRYLWRLTTKWATTPTAGESLRMYLVTSSVEETAALTDGGFTFGDATITSETELYNNCQAIGSVIARAAVGPYCSSGIIYIYERYVAIAGWNGSGSDALTNTVGDHIFTLTPVPDDIQAAS